MRSYRIIFRHTLHTAALCLLIFPLAVSVATALNAFIPYYPPSVMRVAMIIGTVSMFRFLFSHLDSIEVTEYGDNTELYSYCLVAAGSFLFCFCAIFVSDQVFRTWGLLVSSPASVFETYKLQKAAH